MEIVLESNLESWNVLYAWGRRCLGNITLSMLGQSEKNSNQQGEFKLKMQRGPDRDGNRTNVAYSDTRKEAVEIHYLSLKRTQQIENKEDYINSTKW